MKSGLQYHALLENCSICPHKCNSDRFKNRGGFCRASADVEISAALVHHGEEPPVSGSKGSGTIFFKHCNMRCVYCQNFQISQEMQGDALEKTSINNLEECILKLQGLGCHNINFVSPSIWALHIMDVLESMRGPGKSLKIPAVYNTGGYDSPETIRMLEGSIDIYMPDMRYSRNETAFKYSQVKNYVGNNRSSIIEMYRQVGGLKTDKNGIAVRGLITRLLILPGHSKEVMENLDFIKNELSTDVYISIMAQYRPLYKAGLHPEINRVINRDEYDEVVDYAEKLGFCNGAVQELEENMHEENSFVPDFSSRDVFKFQKDKI